MTTTTPTTDDAALDTVASMIGGGPEAPPRTRKPRSRRRAAPGPGPSEPDVQGDALPELTEADVRVFVEMGSAFLAARNPILAMTPAEMDRFTTAGTAFANKYGAAFMRYSVEIALAFAVGSYGFRVYGEIRREQAAKAKAAPAPEEAKP